MAKAPTICDRGADVDVSLSTVSMLGWRLGVVRCDFRLDCGPQLSPPALHTFRSFVYALTLSSLLVFRFRLPSNPATSQAIDFPTLAVGAGPYLFKSWFNGTRRISRPVNDRHATGNDCS